MVQFSGLNDTHGKASVNYLSREYYECAILWQYNYFLYTAAVFGLCDGPVTCWFSIQKYTLRTRRKNTQSPISSHIRDLLRFSSTVRCYLLQECHGS